MGGTAGTGAGSAPGPVITSSAAGGSPNGAVTSAGGGGNAESVVTPWAGFDAPGSKVDPGVGSCGMRSTNARGLCLSAPKSVVTSVAGFAVSSAEDDGRWGSGDAGSEETPEAGFPAPKSVITSMAGFEPALRSQPGGRTGIPAAFKYPAAVSRRTPVAPWMRRSVHPSRPKAITCCFFSSLKTLAISAEAISPHAAVNVPEWVSIWPVFR